jgi:2-iminobutanoate/2-iminopropanoate deaminase
MIEQLNPPSLPTSPAYAQGTVATGTRIVYVGGQNGLDKTGTLADGALKQSEQAMRNVLAVLDAAGATQADVAKLNVHLVESVDPREAYGAVAEVWGPHPTAITVLRVAALGPPGALVEIDAVAVLD